MGLFNLLFKRNLLSLVTHCLLLFPSTFRSSSVISCTFLLGISLFFPPHFLPILELVHIRTWFIGQKSLQRSWQLIFRYSLHHRLEFVSVSHLSPELASNDRPTLAHEALRLAQRLHDVLDHFRALALEGVVQGILAVVVLGAGVAAREQEQSDQRGVAILDGHDQGRALAGVQDVHINVGPTYQGSGKVIASVGGKGMFLNYFHETSLQG